MGLLDGQIFQYFQSIKNEKNFEASTMNSKIIKELIKKGNK